MEGHSTRRTVPEVPIRVHGRGPRSPTTEPEGFTRQVGLGSGGCEEGRDRVLVSGTGMGPGDPDPGRRRVGGGVFVKNPEDSPGRRPDKTSEDEWDQGFSCGRRDSLRRKHSCPSVLHTSIGVTGPPPLRPDRERRSDHYSYGVPGRRGSPGSWGLREGVRVSEEWGIPDLP